MDIDKNSLTPVQRKNRSNRQRTRLRDLWVEFKETYKIAWGLILVNLSQVLLNPVSTMFAGHLGQTELDAVALANSLINIFGNAIVLGMATSCDTYFSQAYGNGQFKYLGVLLQRAMFIHMLLLVLLCTLYINMEQLLLLIGQDQQVARLTAQYMLIFIPGLFFLFIYTILKKYLNCQNNVTSSVIIGFLGLGVDALLQYVFLYHLMWGVYGSAVAQALACFFMFVAILGYIICTGIYKKTWAGLDYRMLEDWWPFTKLGLYGMLMICLEWWAYEVSVLLAGLLGTTELAAQGVFFNIEAIFISVGLGPGDATSIRVGQFLGAGLPNRAALSAKVGFASTAMLGVTVSILIASLRFQLPLLFTNIPAVVHETARLLPILAYYTIFDNIAFIGRGISRGCGLQGKATVLIVVLYYLIGMPIGIPLMFLTPVRNLGVWVGIAVAVTLYAIIFVVYILFFLDWDKASREAMERVRSKEKDEIAAAVEGNVTRGFSRSISAQSGFSEVTPLHGTYATKDTDHEETPLLGYKNGKASKPLDASAVYDIERRRSTIFLRSINVLAVLAVLAIGVLLRLFVPINRSDIDGFYGNETTTADWFSFTGAEHFDS